MNTLRLSFEENELAVCRLKPDSAVPGWAFTSPFYAIVRTQGELSIVCSEEVVPPETPVDRSWKAIKVMGPLDFALTGILASIAQPLAVAGISIFAISTFDTDYVLVKADKIDAAAECLIAAGFQKC